ncbi:hypothetical protein [Flavobacterium okayamense]|uniref:Uncharacterized protein n=1 Tax=Flavobacterium okayamense TaxID=2830782 RepID=A0ABM7S7I3_9FLAO|nr:hypothetical protein [Flavobacterium okayamense]BCY28583.1 hypothetical protein KK2020170_14510 [Flavobacterium okayamense]
MEAKLKFGLDQLLYGMKQNNVEQIYGKADFQFFDEDENVVLVYNKLKAKLTFYADEDFKLGYITTSNTELTFFGTTVLGKSKNEVLELFKANKIEKWEIEIVEGEEMLFNEDNWVFLYFDYNQLIKIEIGAVFNNQDEFDWKF